jgi:hypothetical protein
MSMSLFDEIPTLDRLREEIEKQAAKMSADLRHDIAEFQKNVEKLRENNAPLRAAMDESMRDVGNAGRALVDSLKHAVQRIRDAARDG